MLYLRTQELTKTYMKKPLIHTKSPLQIPVGHIGGGNFTTINPVGLLLRCTMMLCLLIAGAAFFVSCSKEEPVISKHLIRALDADSTQITVGTSSSGWGEDIDITYGEPESGITIVIDTAWAGETYINY